jgi:hypothetical protein
MLLLFYLPLAILLTIAVVSLFPAWVLWAVAALVVLSSMAERANRKWKWPRAPLPPTVPGSASGFFSVEKKRK